MTQNAVRLRYAGIAKQPTVFSLLDPPPRILSYLSTVLPYPPPSVEKKMIVVMMMNNPINAWEPFKLFQYPKA